jgi:hypothetical protein
MNVITDTAVLVHIIGRCVRRMQPDRSRSVDELQGLFLQMGEQATQDNGQAANSGFVGV